MLKDRDFELISRWIDDDLGSEEEGYLMAELSRRPELRSELESMESLRRTVRRASLSDSPPELLDTLMDNFRQTPSPRSRLSFALPLLGFAALLSIGFLFVEEVGRHVVHPTQMSHPIFALKNPPSRPADAPLGPMEELLAEDLEEPVLGQPELLWAEGPLPEPPPDSDATAVLSLDGKKFSLKGLALGGNQRLEVEISGQIIIGCSGASDELCGELLGRQLQGAPDGNYRARLNTAD